MDRVLSLLLADTDWAQSETIAPTLAKIPAHLLAIAAKNKTRIIALKPTERYSDASPVLDRLSIKSDNWPVSPAGLFVVEERTLYLRLVSPMTIAHEFMHALDCALGDGGYLSSVDKRIGRAFSLAQSFVTPYAASGLDEYFAECGRAMVAVNDDRSLWPKVSPERLAACDPAMFARMSGLFTPPTRKKAE